MLLHFAVAALSEPLGAPGVVSISDASSTGSSGSIAGVIFSSTGEFYRYLFGVPIVINNWITPQENMGDYEIRATLSSGDTPSGTIGSWEALDTSRAWELQELVPGTLTCQLLIEIRWTGNNEVQDSATYTITANG